MIAFQLTLAVLEVVHVLHVADRGFPFRNGTVDQVGCNDRILTLQVGIPAVHFFGALIVKDIHRFTEDTHIAHHGKQNAVFEMHFGGFPKGEFQTIETIGKCSGMFEFENIHILKFFVKGAENASPIRVDHALRRGHRSAFFCNKFTVFSHSVLLYRGIL